VIASGLVAPFFLTFEEAGETSLLVAERDPANRVTRVDLITNLTSLVAGGFSSRPGAVALMSAKLTSQDVVELAKIVAVPLLAGFSGSMVFALLK